MRRTITLAVASLTWSTASLQVVANPCWEMVLPDVIACVPCQVAWTPYPVAPPWCTCSFLPRRLRSRPSGQGLDSPDYPHDATSMGHCFRDCSHSLMFKPAYSLDFLIAPTTDILSERLSLIPRAYFRLLPPKSAVSLRD